MEKSFNDESYLKICSEKTLQTNSKGFFMDFVEIVSNAVGEPWIRNVFGQLKTDRERMKAIYNFEEVSINLINPFCMSAVCRRMSV